MIDRRMRSKEKDAFLSKIIAEVRKDHPTLSCRAMYHKINPLHIGRDAFEALCKDLGFAVGRKPGVPRTTDSYGVTRFDNLLMELELTNVNQAWSSDITYFEIDGEFHFITFIIDCYSRKILGYSVSARLLTVQTTLPALQMAIKRRGGNIPAGLIFHSDGGGQYYAKEFLNYTRELKIRNSMCEYAYENGMAERLNGVIKNNYLAYYQIKSLKELSKSVDRAVSLYNNDRPHKSLKYQTPSTYENQIVLLKQQTAQR